MTKAHRGVQILRSEGPFTFFKKAVSYLQWNIRQSYSLTIDDVTVSFSAPTHAVVRANKTRYESEYEIISDILNNIEKDDVFYDIGANTGIYSLFVSQKCPHGQVFAFEPYPPNAQLLKRDVHRNDLTNVEIFEVALSNESGEVNFSQPRTDQPGCGSASIDPENTSAITIPSKAGDELVTNENIPAPDVLKIDVEGAEPLVIDGLEQTLQRNDCRLIYCEIHLPGNHSRPSVEDFGASPADLEAKLKEFGFSIEQIQFRETDLFFKAHKNPS